MKREQGFTYLFLIVAVTLLSIGLAGIGVLTSASAQHARRQQLVWIGNQYVKAIGDYYQSSPGSVSTYPTSLDDLIEDKRYLSIRRHLRELYRDPATDLMDWIVIKAPDGGVMGVESPTTDAISAVQFVYTPPAPQGAPSTQNAPSRSF